MTTSHEVRMTQNHKNSLSKIHFYQQYLFLYNVIFCYKSMFCAAAVKNPQKDISVLNTHKHLVYLIQGDIMPDHTSQTIYQCWQSYCPWSIAVTVYFIRRSREITNSCALEIQNIPYSIIISYNNYKLQLVLGSWCINQFFSLW